MIESVEEPGLYRVPVRLESEGMHTLSFRAENAEGRPVGRTEAAFFVHPDHRELVGDRYRPDFLRSLAERTGGAFFPLDEVGRLPAALPVDRGEEEHVDRIPLWHLPPLYGLAALLLCLEWYLRRRRGHP